MIMKAFQVIYIPYFFFCYVRRFYESFIFLFFLSERLNAMLKKLFDAQITGDVHEELVKASANCKIIHFLIIFIHI
jgi:hypothetical protein